MSFDLKVSNGDLILVNGDLQTITGTNKLVQDIIKICLTPAGANIYQPFYGSFITKTLIGSVLDADITDAIAKNQLQNSIDNLKKLQQLQVLNTLQNVTPDEQIAGIQGISVNRDTIDLRQYNISVSVLSRAFQQVPISFSVNGL